MVNVEGEIAPARLEIVRSLLNTWLVPNDTRVGTDTITDLFRDRAAWAHVLRSLPHPRSRAALLELVEVRDRLRRLVEEQSPARADARWLQEAIGRHPLGVAADAGTGGLTVTLTAAAASDPTAIVLAAVVEAMQAGTWSRLKACPGCRWVFFDHSRSATKTWCGMNRTGPNGRACGSIAKVQAFRRRSRAASADTSTAGTD